MKLFFNHKLYEKNIFSLILRNNRNDISSAKNRYHKLLFYYISRRKTVYCDGFYYALGNYDVLFDKEIELMVKRNREIENDDDFMVCECFCPAMVTDSLKGAIISNRPDMIDKILKLGTILRYLVNRIQNIVLKNYIENYRVSHRHYEPMCDHCGSDDLEDDLY